MEKLRAWTNGMVNSIQNAAERINNNTLTDNDRNTIGVMLIQLEQAIRNSPSYEQDSAVQNVAAKLRESFVALMDNNAELLLQNQDELSLLMYYGRVFVTEPIQPENSIFMIRGYSGEEIYFENTSGLNAEELCEAYAKCESPYREMYKYGDEIDGINYSAIQQRENLPFSVEFNEQNDRIITYDREYNVVESKRLTDYVNGVNELKPKIGNVANSRDGGVYLHSEKPSGLGKLEQNKETAAKNKHEKERTMEPRNKDVPEIA